MWSLGRSRRQARSAAGGLSSLERLGLGIEQMLLPSASEPVPGSRPWVPEVRVLNRRRSVVIRLVSPCIDPRKIRIQLSGHMLTLTASTVDLHPDHSGYRAFRRTILLPGDIDGRRISARAGDHVLTLRLSKSHG